MHDVPSPVWFGFFFEITVFEFGLLFWRFWGDGFCFLLKQLTYTLNYYMDALKQNTVLFF